MICSIIVTAYNQVSTIAQTIESILSQNCNFSFEIIIGDDCSTDGTRAVCLEYYTKYPKIIHLLFHEINRGVAANFVLCVKKALGKYISICAADDFWHNKSKLQLEVDFLEKKKDYGFIYTDYDKLNVNTGKITKYWLKTSGFFPYQGKGLIKLFFAGKVQALTLTVMFRKELFEKYVPVNDYIKLEFPIEDWPTWLILSKYTKIGYLPDSTGTYRYGHESLSNLKEYSKIEEKYRREKIMYKYLCDMFPQDLQFEEIQYDMYVFSILLNMAFKQNDYDKAKMYGKKLDNGSIKVLCSKNKIFFYLFVLLKRFRNSRKEINI